MFVYKMNFLIVVWITRAYKKARCHHLQTDADIFQCVLTLSSIWFVLLKLIWKLNVSQSTISNHRRRHQASGNLGFKLSNEWKKELTTHRENKVISCVPQTVTSNKSVWDMILWFFVINFAVFSIVKVLCGMMPPVWILLCVVVEFN